MEKKRERKEGTNISGNTSIENIKTKQNRDKSGSLLGEDNKNIAEL